MERDTTTSNERALPLVLAWVALAVLTAASFGARYLPLGVFATPVALAIAVAKACVVLTWFMQLGREQTSIRLLVWVVLGTVALACLGVIGDTAFRDFGVPPPFSASVPPPPAQKEPP